MYLIRKRRSDNVYRTGIICMLISLAFFCLPVPAHAKEQGNFGMFLANFILTAVYFIYRLANRKHVSAEAKIHHVLLLLILFFISAWALNHELTVFEEPASWFMGLLVLLCLNYLAVAYFGAFPPWARHLVSFINGAALVTFLYLTCFLVPLYAAGLVAFFLLGVSLHVFVPLLISIYTIVLQSRVTRRKKQYWASFTGGIVTVLGIVIAYCIQWAAVSKQVNRTWLEAENNKTGLPAWVLAAQNLRADGLTQTMLKGDLVYTMPEMEAGSLLWRTPRRNLGEKRQHHPLVMIAAFFNGEVQIDADNRIKILRAGLDLHHEAEDRLWTDEHLRTDSVNTEVKLWPRCNLAYTEKTITVSNENYRNTRGWQEEALYTFYMPEGSVVTSLSLWVQGKEEKGILTTKGQAESAYKAIVGVERRDPSVVHWQEGNTVLVRVFPVIAGEKRQFKIGITSPLERIDGKLRYENIYFKGPAFDRAGETIRMDFEQPVTDFDLPASFVSKVKQSYNREGPYDPAWGLQINDPGLSGCSFSFDGNEYSLSPYHKKLSPAAFTSIWLDINQSWTKDEYETILAQAKDRDVLVYNNGIVKLQETNKDELWTKLHGQRFSLFPLYEIPDAPHALLVTKHAPSALHLADLEGTDFMNRTRQFLAHGTRLSVFNLGDELSVYLRSLKEFRVFRYDNGDAALLARRLQSGLFPEDIENDNRVVIHRTDMVVEKIPGAKEASGPDHVMRLFAYNHIMQKLGPGLLLDRPVEDSLVQEAQTAYVVTPVSSLVVLETQQDYDRFNIKDNASSLKNASLHAKGAVPEPHEWALIALVAVVLVYVIRKRKPQYRLQ